MRQRPLTVLATICLGILPSACKKQDGGSGGTGANPPASPNVKEIRIGMMEDAGAAPIVVAQTQGLFEKHGLTATLINLESTEEVAQQLASGAIEVGMLYPGDALAAGGLVGSLWFPRTRTR